MSPHWLRWERTLEKVEAERDLRFLGSPSARTRRAGFPSDEVKGKTQKPNRGARMEKRTMNLVVRC